MLAEVEERRLLDAVAAVPEVDLVHVEVEDLILGERLLHARGEDPLADLPAQACAPGVSRRFRHACWVMVEAPVMWPPGMRLLMPARTMPT